MQLTEYIQILTDQIRCKKAHPMIVEEYTAHIEDQADAYMQSGMEKEEALEAAITQMGDPVEAGVALDRVHRPKMCVSLMVTILVLTLIGIVTQSVIFKDVDDTYVQETYLLRSIAYNLIGFAVMAIVCYLDYSFLSKHILGFYGGWYLFIICLNLFFEVSFINGQRVLNYQLLAFFPPIYAGILFYYRNQGLKGFLKAALLLLLALPPITASNSASGCVELYAVALILWTAAFLKGWYGNKRWLKVSLLWAFAILLPASLIAKVVMGPAGSYRAIRLKAFFHPEAYAGAEGYVATQIQNTVGKLSFDGSITSLQNQLPNSYNDFIILSIFSYFGIVIGLLVCGFIVFFFVKAFGISMKQKNQLAQMVGLSCVMELLMRAFIYITANFGLCPLSQMNMPFLSFGLTGTLVNSVLAGLLLSIYRYENVLGEKQMSSNYRYRLKIEKINS